MAAGLTYRELRRETRLLAKEIRQATDAHRKTAATLDDEAKDTGRIAEQIASLNVDTATVAETREVSRITRGISETALSYATAAHEAAVAAAAAERQAVNDHGGIQEAADRSPAPMANASFYTQE